MQIFSYLSLYTASQIYKKKQEKNQTSSLYSGNNSFTLPNYYGISFKALYVPTEFINGLSRFENVFPSVLLPKIVSLNGFDNFIKNNEDILTAGIDEILSFGEWDSDDERSKAEDLLRAKTGISGRSGSSNPITDNVKRICARLGYNDRSKKFVKFNAKINKSLKKQKDLLKKRKEDFKIIFPDVDFDNISDKPEQGKINKVITIKQLLEKIPDKTVSGKSIEELIQTPKNVENNKKVNAHGQGALITRIIKNELEKIPDSQNMLNQKSKGMTIATLAKLIGCDYTSLKQGVNNKRDIPDNALRKMASILGVTYEEIKGWTLANEYSNNKDGIDILICALKAKSKKQEGKRIQATELKRSMIFSKFNMIALGQSLGYKTYGSLDAILTGKRDIPDDIIPKLAEILNIPEQTQGVPKTHIIKGWKIADYYHEDSIRTALNILIKEKIRNSITLPE